ncbi:unnamed protein product [Vitrella brassicaformis CCMP3155]|uniref:Uncharacterized protein n=1 Tax=Vitrella brassicaformis (strain CCMP3155) TaxID=1169540 RepID=A0A0G4GN73_VITBC|nr:unnamed protein product [Vitrella brassicaformis CCMP3155]|mmetsp:Transcript_26289/g.65360  ORF Transcript_26289/g.65360 Transcript_26289/m.65360 type:complete len:359 (-) Transcript_26289:277-1353(-)|eukprot:CEM31615.1 unnamed protein product [Vitrella brassicaformis CCMP3155]
MFLSRISPDGKRQFEAIASKIDEDDRRLVRIKELRKSVRDSRDSLEKRALRLAEDQQNTDARMRTTEMTLEKWNEEATELEGKFNDFLRLAQRVAPSEGEAPSGSVTLPSQYFQDLYVRLGRQLWQLKMRLKEVDEAIQMMQQDAQATQGTWLSLHLSRIEKIFRAQHYNYKHLAVTLSRLSKQVDGLKAVAARNPQVADLLAKKAPHAVSGPPLDLPHAAARQAGIQATLLGPLAGAGSSLLFGQPQPQAAASPLFTSPQQTGGLGASLFSAPQGPGGGLFGASSQGATTSLFGASQPARGGIFGAQSGQQQTAGLFGATTAGGLPGGAAGAAFLTPQTQQQQQQPHFGTAAPFVRR